MVDLFFSFASFGFSEPYWYLFGGLSVVTARLAAKLAPETEELALRRTQCCATPQTGLGASTASDVVSTDITFTHSVACACEASAALSSYAPNA